MNYDWYGGYIDRSHGALQFTTPSKKVYALSIIFRTMNKYSSNEISDELRRFGYRSNVGAVGNRWEVRIGRRDDVERFLKELREHEAFRFDTTRRLADLMMSAVTGMKVKDREMLNDLRVEFMRIKKGEKY